MFCQYLAYVKIFIKVTSMGSKLHQRQDRTDENPFCAYKAASQSLAAFGVMTEADPKSPSSTLCKEMWVEKYFCCGIFAFWIFVLTYNNTDY